MAEKNKFAEEEAQGYRLKIFGKSVQVTEAMMNYARDKVAKIEHFHNHIMDIQITMDIQRLEHVVVIVVKLEHFKIKVQANSSDIYASIEEAVKRLESKIRRWKDRIQDHTAKKMSVVDMQVNVLRRPYDFLDEINKEIELETRKENEAALRLPKVIGKEIIPLKTLTTNEAVMKMELSDDNFLIFRGEEDRKLKVIYRRSDGDYGIIQTE